MEREGNRWHLEYKGASQPAATESKGNHSSNNEVKRKRPREMLPEEKWAEKRTIKIRQTD